MRRAYWVKWIPTVARFGYLANASGMVVVCHDEAGALQVAKDSNRWAETYKVPFTETVLAAVGRFEVAR